MFPDLIINWFEVGNTVRSYKFKILSYYTLINSKNRIYK